MLFLTYTALLLPVLSPVILVNGGTGLVKLAMKCFMDILILPKVRFPLHDHMKEKYSWSAAQIT